MFIMALFTIIKVGSQPTCSLTDEWLKKCNTCIMEFYSAIKKNEIMLPEEKNNGLGDNHPK
jgi:hypothetical protein